MARHTRATPFSPETLRPPAFAFREDRFLAASSFAEHKPVRYQGGCEKEVDCHCHPRRTARNRARGKKKETRNETKGMHLKALQESMETNSSLDPAHDPEIMQPVFTRTPRQQRIDDHVSCCYQDTSPALGAAPLSLLDSTLLSSPCVWVLLIQSNSSISQ